MNLNIVSYPNLEYRHIDWKKYAVLHNCKLGDSR